MSTRWTQPTESENKRKIINAPKNSGREIRAVSTAFRPLLELKPLYFGGASRAG